MYFNGGAGRLVELAKHLNIYKVTVGRYLKSGLVFNKTYRFKSIQD